MSGQDIEQPIEPEDIFGEETEDPIREALGQQDAELQQYAIAFITKVIRLRGVRIDRDSFLRQEFRKLRMSDEQIQKAIETTPSEAGVSLEQLDELASQVIGFETKKSASLSFAAGLPGGFAMLATIPTDVAQYYAHAFRVMQKLAYIYGWQNFINDLDEIDDETLAKLAMFLGVMMGVSGAATSLTTFVRQITMPALQKQITKQALTKTVWYGPMKQTLRIIGVKVTKDSFAKTITKAVPVAGGLLSGGMTLVALKSQSVRLQKQLRQIPPPGVDAAKYMAELHEVNTNTDHNAILDKAVGAVEGAVEAVPDTVKETAGNLASSAKEAGAEAASQAKHLAGSLFSKVSRKKAETEETGEDPQD
ncbi:EcsC family protein [Boudabousia marimammalium]|uniref:Bacteriochlorophyll 4-vinyl reductase n=1 Tax=Boudabousia marimammalium TaxID=156892 RepID=A0A1Q5PS36_9ACTO|nr:EcsC family protein [Boudabousia marimammalium]OKL50255.1 hypothetical protein BM477_02360 [Boudabousia marimammalium]